eukprot:CAMPEP_0174260310 /NCGR_PEP_ID=MMETSP0439-20130205/9536_1 /TAXON_ID=0 /ORGANISM="Stereomyxa ramosa, Strain Chinc5" /LENGTH=1088 /DNA_ID=CAMNT_0015344525 /DNA_START=16 /DNA_END=3282 /DNA_ORIENTATION=+
MEDPQDEAWYEISSEEESEEVSDNQEESEEEENENIGSFTWQVENVKSLKEDKLFSEVFIVGESPWKLMLFTKGNKQQPHTNGMISIYLTAEHSKREFFCRSCKFSISLINLRDETKTITKSSQHTFRHSASDWGFNVFVPMKEAVKGGFIVDDVLKIKADLEVQKTPGNHSWSMWSSWDSKKETGYVGLKNQGATCYMNSLLQALYHLEAFRLAVYQMPTQNDSPSSSIPLALQRIFYRLQFSDNGVGTKELTASFGWDRREAFIQHDVQELNRVFCDNLEEKMKGTISEGIVEKLFRGKIYNYIKCKNVDYESSRPETFYDISLNVKGCKDVYESFEQYIATESMDGDNKYDAGPEHGLQAADRGCYFQSFPPVLELHLKRFVYDFERDRNSKINDRYEFPENLKLKKFMSKDGDFADKPLYRLYAVLVHSGDVHGGHYYAFIRPTTKKQWYKFDDDRVTKAKKKEVFEGTFGGTDKRSYKTQTGRTITSTYKKCSNAYMLFYIRAHDRAQILAPIAADNIPAHLHERFEREEAEKAQKKKEKEEAHLYLKVKVARIENMKEHNDSDLVDFDAVKIFKVKRDSTLEEFKEILSQEFSVHPAAVRLWTCFKRKNKTIRPDEPISEENLKKQFSDYVKSHQAETKFFMEVAVLDDDEQQEIPEFPPHTAEDAIIFLKWYDPKKECLTFLDFTFVKVTDSLSVTFACFKNTLGLPDDADLTIFEEIKPNMIEKLDPRKSFKAAEIGNGDIICGQLTPDSSSNVKRALAPEYYNYMRNRVTVRFRELTEPKEDKFVIEMDKEMSYDDVVGVLGKKLEFDPMKLRLTQHSRLYEKPRPHPVKRSSKNTLTEMLAGAYYYQSGRNDILYYEKLDISIEELERNKLLKIDWYNSSAEIEKSFKILVPKTANFSDVSEKLMESLIESELLDNPDSAHIRFFEIHNNRIYRMLNMDTRTTGFNEHTALRAEEVPQEEIEKEDSDIVIQVTHISYIHSPVPLTFGNPFRLLVKEGETFGETKARIQKKLSVEDSEFEKWKFAVVPYLGRPKYIEDDNVELAKKMDQKTDYLGLEHKMPKHKSTYARRPEVGIIIKG